MDYRKAQVINCNKHNLEEIINLNPNGIMVLTIKPNNSLQGMGINNHKTLILFRLWEEF